jgi:hypothetical protein
MKKIFLMIAVIFITAVMSTSCSSGRHTTGSSYNKKGSSFSPNKRKVASRYKAGHLCSKMKSF